MKKFFVLMGVALLGSSLFAAEFPDVTISEVKALAKSKKAVIIDVNGSESYAQGHVPGALDYEAIAPKLADVLPKDKKTPIVAYCDNPKCQAYLSAVRAAEKLSYKNVKHMPAGIAGWKEAGEKTEKGSKST